MDECLRELDRIADLMEHIGMEVEASKVDEAAYELIQTSPHLRKKYRV
jgi:ribosome assembly protein YihI (activator of Der GTPase)